MLRTLLLIVPFCAGCNEYSRAHLIDAAANAALVGAVLLTNAIIQDAMENGGVANVSTSEVDDQGRRARLVARFRCGDDRSYKLLCVPQAECYFERNDARIIRCATRDCDDTPLELDAWCQGR